jgi:hypothetical protein
MTDGKYTARVIDYGIGETKAGLPQVILRFEFMDTEKNIQRMNWFGTLKEGKGREMTAKALLNCGFTGSDLSTIACGPESKVFSENLDVEIDVQTENDLEGKPRQRIRWINKVGGSSFKKLSKEDAVRKLSGINIKGEILAMQQGSPESEEAPF